MKPFALSSRITAAAALGLTALTSLAAPSMASRIPASQGARLLQHMPLLRIQADLNDDHLAENLEAKLATAPADQPIAVIVQYKLGRQPARIVGAARGVQQLGTIHSMVQRLTPGEIRGLVASGAVERVDVDGRRFACRQSANVSFGVTHAAAAYGLTGDDDKNPSVYSPQDLTIAVIDSGIDGTHQDFAGDKIIAWKDFVNGWTQPYDDLGHGTHVASIAAGAVNARGVGGVAPGASLVGLKVLDADGSGYDSVIIRAVEWCIQNRQRYGIDVINLSLGGADSSDGNDPLSKVVNKAVEAGIIVCCAAGNEGPNLYTISSPAAAEKAITVGNMADLGKGGFYLASSSSHGPTANGRVKPDLCAPGVAILAAKADSGQGYIRMTGTSMASPFVAGVAALMLQANPKLTPAKVKAMLKQTAVHFGSSGENNDYGAGRLDGSAALARAASKGNTGPGFPLPLHASGRLATEGATQVWSLRVNDARFPVAVTMLIEAPKTDFELEIYDPNGDLVTGGWEASRHEQVSFVPEPTGIYTVVVRSYTGLGTYTLDLSNGSWVK